MLRSEFGEHEVEHYAEVAAVLLKPIVLFEGWGVKKDNTLRSAVPPATSSAQPGKSPVGCIQRPTPLEAAG